MSDVDKGDKGLDGINLGIGIISIPRTGMLHILNPRLLRKSHAFAGMQQGISTLNIPIAPLALLSSFALPSLFPAGLFAGLPFAIKSRHYLQKQALLLDSHQVDMQLAGLK